MEKHIKEKVKMVKKPEDAENVQGFKKIITSNKKNVQLAYYQGIVFCILKKRMKTIPEICKQNRCEYQ